MAFAEILNAGKMARTKYRFEVHHARVECPKCGANQAPMIGLLVLTHLMIRDEKGPILCKKGRYRLACNGNKDRKHLATRTNLEAATDQYEVANCPGCLAEAEKLGIKPKIWQYEGS